MAGLDVKRVLVTGGSGFIGRECLPRLAARGFQVHSLSRQVQADHPVVCWHRGDFREAAAIVDLLAQVQPTHLLHLAWCTEPRTFWNSAENADWRERSEVLFRNFDEAGGRRIVGTGSCAEYDWSNGVCHEEQTRCEPQTRYGQAKLSAGMSLMAMNPGRLSTAWARLFFIYGPLASDRRIPGAVISALLRNEPALCSDGLQQRDFLHVADVAEALVRLVDSDLSGAVNVCSGEAVSIREIAVLAAELLGKRELLKLGALPRAAHEPPLIVGDGTRLRRELNWTPRFTLESGLRDTVAHSLSSDLSRGE